MGGGSGGGDGGGVGAEGMGMWWRGRVGGRGWGMRMGSRWLGGPGPAVGLNCPPGLGCLWVSGRIQGSVDERLTAFFDAGVVADLDCPRV